MGTSDLQQFPPWFAFANYAFYAVDFGQICGLLGDSGGARIRQHSIVVAAAAAVLGFSVSELMGAYGLTSFCSELTYYLDHESFFSVRLQANLCVVTMSKWVEMGLILFILSLELLGLKHVWSFRIRSFRSAHVALLVHALLSPVSACSWVAWFGPHTSDPVGHSVAYYQALILQAGLALHSATLYWVLIADTQHWLRVADTLEVHLEAYQGLVGLDTDTAAGDSTMPRIAAVIDSMRRRPSWENFQIPVSHIHFSDIKICEVIGRGATATTYKGQLTETLEQQRVAVKRIKCQELNQAMLLEYCYELMIAGVLQGNQHIVKHLGFSINNPYLDVVMERCNVDLYTLLHSDLYTDTIAAPLPFSTRMKLASGAADGVAHMHDLRIIHRDIKSPNILVTTTDAGLMSKLCDFGESIQMHHHEEDQGLIGTPDWCAPELFDCPRQYSQRSDTYALALVTFECISQKSLPSVVQAEAPKFKTFEIFSEQGGRPRLDRVEWGESLCDTIAVAWHQTVEDRVSARFLANELNNALACEPSCARREMQLLEVTSSQETTRTFSTRTHLGQTARTASDEAANKTPSSPIVQC